MSPFKHILYKCSDPGFELHTNDESVVLSSLLCGICHTCLEHEVSEDFEKFSVREKIGELLATPCGCEYAVDFDVK